ncbi:MAG: hypothetical protein EOO26_02825, partial [Comamonadaceae bacterium]
MNIRYRSIWNHALNAWVAVSEIARGQGKRSSGAVVAGAIAAAVLGGSATQALAQSYSYADGENRALGLAVDGITTLTVNTGAAVQSGPLTSPTPLSSMALRKLGEGTLTLSGTNSFLALIDITSGTLRVLNDGNLGDSRNNFFFTGNGTLQFAQSGFATARGITTSATATIDVAGTEGNVFSGSLSSFDVGGKLRLVNSAAPSAVNNTRLTFTSSKNTSFTGGTQIGTAGGVGSPGRLNTEVTGVGTLGTGPVDIYYNAALGFQGATASAAGLNITVHESSNEQGTNSGVGFANGATAGNANITLSAAGTYVAANDAGSSLGSSTITNNGGRIYVQQTSNGGTSTILNNGGIVSLDQLADMSGAKIVNNGVGDVRVAFSDVGVAIGELSGDGTVTLGAKRLTVGALNTSTTISGPISDLGKAWVDKNGQIVSYQVDDTGGSVVKVGSGTLTLAGANAYSGGTAVNGGALRIAADNNLGLATGGLSLDGGTLNTAASFASARAVTIGAGNGAVLPDAGTTLQLDGVIGGVGTLVKNGAGQLNLTGVNTYAGGTVVNGGIVQVVANSNLGQATSGLFLNNGATLRYGAGFTSARPIGLGGTGGTIDTNGNAALLSGVVSGTGRLTKTGTLALTLTGNNTYTGGTTISGGALQLGNGGTSGSIVGDVVNNAILVFNRSDAVGLAGVVSGSGVLQQVGAGTTTLTGANTYSGGTAVSGGTLSVNNTTGSGTGTGAVNVLPGGQLGGSGTIAGPVNIANGGTLAPGNSPGTLTTGNLTLNNGSILNYEFGQANTPGGALNDLVNVNGNLVLDGTLNVATSAGGAFLPGVYRVFNYTGALTNNTLNLGVLPVANSGLAVQTSVANQVNLVNSTGVALQYWDGGAATNHGPTGIEGNGVAEGGAGTWQGAAGNGNWTVASGTGNAPWTNGGFAVFQGKAGAVTVDSVTQGPINFQGAQFDADGYVLLGGTLNASTATTNIRVGAGGAGANTTATINSVISDTGVAGGSQLVKTDPGTLILAGANTYAGGTAVNGGVLQVGADNNLGAAAGGLSFNAGTLRSGAAFNTARAVTLNAGGGAFDTTGGNVALTGVVSGAGALTKTGVGTLTLGNANTYAGGTALNGGTLALNTSTSASTGAIAMAGGTTLAAGAAGLVVANDITTAGAAQIDGGAGAFTLGGTIGGAGSVTKTGTGVTTFTGNNTYTGGTTIAAGTLQVGNGGTTGSIVGNVTNNATLAINRSDDTTLAGDIGGTGNLQKLGAGTLALSGNNSYSGGTALLKGRIDVGSNSALGTGALAMSDGTTLGFTANNLDIANPVALTGTFDPVIDTGAFTETLSGAITGAGILTKNGSGTLIFSGANTYTGATNVAQGTLRAGAANSFSSASAHVVSTGATLDTGGFNQRVASLSNSGTVSLLSAAPGSTLTVNGAYVGNGGVLRLGTALGNSASASDRLVLDGAGASASGNTTVQVTNVGGLGALTTGNGITLIGAQNGATTAANAFTLAGGHVDAGAYEYRLYDGDASGAGESWFLRSTSTVPVTPTNPTTPTTPTTPAVTQPTYRAEVPLYAALPSILRQGDLAMLSTLHRRVGDES